MRSSRLMRKMMSHTVGKGCCLLGRVIPVDMGQSSRLGDRSRRVAKVIWSARGRQSTSRKL